MSVVKQAATDPCAEPRKGRRLLSIEEAQALAAALVEAPVAAELLPLGRLAGRVSAEDVASPTPLPPFDHSAMDGYALASLSGPHMVRARLPAGSGGLREALRPGEAARIMTGAPMPPGAVAVAMQERVAVEGDRITPQGPLEPGANIRRRGEDVSVGDVIVPAGVRLDARHVAILAAAGVAEIAVRRRVVVGLMSTGDELVRPGRPLAPGMIHDANRPMLAALLGSQPALEIVDLGVAPDDREELARLVADAASRCDALVTSGATSVGEEDHLAAAVTAAGGRLDLASVAIKPGKPVVVGHVGSAVLVGLPGNPFAALVAWLLVGRVALERLAGLAPKPLAPLAAIAAFSEKGGRRVEFAPARIVGRAASGLPIVDKLGRGGSARLAPLIAADGLAVIPADLDGVQEGGAIGFLPFEAAAEL